MGEATEPTEPSPTGGPKNIVCGGIIMYFVEGNNAIVTEHYSFATNRITLRGWGSEAI